MSAAPVATAMPPAIPRAPLVVRFDINEATSNIDLLAIDLEDDGSNRQTIILRILQEMAWLGELLAELEAAP